MNNMSNRKTARLVRGPWQDYTERCLWFISDGEYIITSSTNHYVTETMAFPSDEDGSMDNLQEVGWSGYDDHEGAIRCAGYEIEADDEDAADLEALREARADTSPRVKLDDFLNEDGDDDQ